MSPSKPPRYRCEVKVRFLTSDLETVPEEVARPLCSRCYTVGESRRFTMFSNGDEIFSLIFDKEPDDGSRENQFDVYITPCDDPIHDFVRESGNVEIVPLQTEEGIEFLRFMRGTMEETHADYGLLNAEPLRIDLAKRDAGESAFKVGDLVRISSVWEPEPRKPEGLARVTAVHLSVSSAAGNPEKFMYSVRTEKFADNFILPGSRLELI
jgi:hypothetical protein